MHKSSIKSTILSVSVHRDTENPIFGRGATIVSIVDEGGGGFIKLVQCSDNSETCTVMFDIEELDAIQLAAHMLLDQYDTNQEPCK